MSTTPFSTAFERGELLVAVLFNDYLAAGKPLMRKGPGMGRVEAIDRLKAYEPSAAALGVRSLFLFGSLARDDGREESDVDVFVDYDADRFGLFELARLKRELTALLGRAADVGTRDGLHPMLRDAIEQEAVQVF